MFYGQFDYWALNHKVSFDPILKLITIGSDITEITVRSDLYSDWKEWALLEGNSRYRPALRAVGGDRINATEVTGSTFFLTNGWRIYVDHAITFDGNLYSDDYDSPFLEAPGVKLVKQKVSTLVETVKPSLVGLNIPTAQEIADAVWSKNLTTISTTDSIGVFIKDKILTVKKFLGLS